MLGLSDIPTVCKCFCDVGTASTKRAVAECEMPVNGEQTSPLGAVDS